MTDFLRPSFQVTHFSDFESIPAADIIVFLKFLPSVGVLARVSQQARVVFMPVDIFGSCGEIDENAERLQHVALTIVHSRRLSRYFSAYCNVEYLDHPLNFTLNSPRRTTESGPLIWIGQQCNLAPVIDWLNSDRSVREVWILTNFPDDLNISDIEKDLIRSRVRIEQWTPASHMRYLELATAAIDIKGNDFRSRNKPPAKSFDFAASGIPVIVSRGSSADYDFGHIKYTPLYSDSWQVKLDDDYRQYVYDKAFPLRNFLNAEYVWTQLREALERELDRVSS